jgi:hypothetical protein
VTIDVAKAPAGECGVEDQVGRVGVFFMHPLSTKFCLAAKLVSVGSDR